jgi:hypothetical protein
VISRHGSEYSGGGAGEHRRDHRDQARDRAEALPPALPESLDVEPLLRRHAEQIRGEFGCLVEVVGARRNPPVAAVDMLADQPREEEVLFA